MGVVLYFAPDGRQYSTGFAVLKCTQLPDQGLFKVGVAAFHPYLSFRRKPESRTS